MNDEDIRESKGIEMEEINYIVEYEKTKDKFNKYIEKNYDLKINKLKYKIDHTHRVVELAEYIARDLNLNEEDVYIAKLIALFHDLGRFEQITRFDSFEDHKTIDHGKFGVDVLFKENLIREFLDETKYDTFLKEGIINHNKYEIETKRLSEQELLHVKIIRDADKTDALYIRACKEYFIEAKYKAEDVENSFVSDIVYEDFMDEKTVYNTSLETPADRWMSNIAFIFGYYFTSGLKVVQKENYINLIKDRLNFKNEETINKIQNMYTLAENYINYRIDNNINF